jgi:hypothetical protein
MTHRCFSSSQLYALRNNIEVRMLIEETLRIPCRMTQGCFRFLCPLCNGFNTAVNPETNLARCFDCSKNFNTIDLVMLCRQAKFVDSVKFLQSIHQKDDEGHNHLDFKTISAGNRQAQGRMNPKTLSKRSPHGIGEILDSVLPPIHGGIAENRKVASKSNKSMAARKITVEDRIVKLEQNIKLLDRQIKKIARTLDVGPASK